MHPTSSQAAISPQAVRGILQSLVFLTVPARPSPLLHLRLVDAYLNENQFPITLESRRFALEKILLDLIVNRFHTLCAVFQLDPPSRNESYKQALITIRSFAQTAYPELIGWCWLYYRYVRSELEIPPELFSNLCSVDARTVRRYLDYVIRRLTTLLIQAEWQANQQCYRIRPEDRDAGWNKSLESAVVSVPFIVIVDTYHSIRSGT